MMLVDFIVNEVIIKYWFLSICSFTLFNCLLYLIDYHMSLIFPLLASYVVFTYGDSLNLWKYKYKMNVEIKNCNTSFRLDKNMLLKQIENMDNDEKYRLFYGTRKNKTGYYDISLKDNMVVNNTKIYLKKYNWYKFKKSRDLEEEEEIGTLKLIGCHDNN